MRWKHLDIVAFDTETTGLDPYQGDRVIEISLVVLRLGEDGSITVPKVVSHLVNPGVPIPRTVTNLTGLKDEDLIGKPPFAEIAAEVGELLGRGIAVAHNYPFDHAFLQREFLIAGVPWTEPLAAIDTVDVSVKHHRDAKSHKLGDLAKRLGVALTEAHRAANDAEACGRCFLEMVRRADVVDDLAEMLEWADGVGRPPEDGPLGVDERGVPVFREGPHEGAPVVDHPLHLAWMEVARVHRSDGWVWRYPDSTRRWLRRFLDVRTSGRARSSPRTFHASDWVLDSCITVPSTPR